MPTISTCLYFVLTISHIREYENLFQDKLLLLVPTMKSEKYLIVKELGAGDNPHFNIVLEFKENTRSDKLINLFLKIYKELIPDYKKTKNDIVSRAVYDVAQLIGGYLQKEDKIEFWNSGFDIEKFKESVVKIVSTKGSNFHTKITLDNFLLCIIQFIDVNGISPPDNKNQIKDIVLMMIKANYNFAKVLNRIGYICCVVLSHYGIDYALNQYIETQIDKEFKI